MGSLDEYCKNTIMSIIGDFTNVLKQMDIINSCKVDIITNEGQKSTCLKEFSHQLIVLRDMIQKYIDAIDEKYQLLNSNQNCGNKQDQTFDIGSIESVPGSFNGGKYSEYCSCSNNQKQTSGTVSDANQESSGLEMECSTCMKMALQIEKDQTGLNSIHALHFTESAEHPVNSSGKSAPALEVSSEETLRCEAFQHMSSDSCGLNSSLYKAPECMTGGVDHEFEVKEPSRCDEGCPVTHKQKLPKTPGKSYSCSDCGQSFTSWRNRFIHMSKMHPNVPMDSVSCEIENDEGLSGAPSLPFYCCKTCHVVCSSMQKFDRHTCKFPSDSGDLSSQLPNRVLVSNVPKLHQLRKYICEMCGSEFHNFKRISYHIPKCFPGPYLCSVCNQAFDTRKSLDYHKKKLHRGNKCFSCDECDKAFERNTSLQKHLIAWHESQTRVGPFPCDLCPKKFIQKIYLTNHKLRMHGLDKKYVCQICGNKFVSQSSLSGHLSRHKNLNKFECCECHRHFKRKDKLKEHQMTHSGERPYVCQVCGHGFITNCKLSEHTRRHGREHRYRCSLCVKSYAGSHDLKHHMKKVHNKTCDKVFRTVVAPTESRDTITETQQDSSEHLILDESNDASGNMVLVGPSLPQPPVAGLPPVTAALGASMALPHIEPCSQSIEVIQPVLQHPAEYTLPPVPASTNSRQLSYVFTSSFEIVPFNEEVI